MADNCGMMTSNENEEERSDHESYEEREEPLEYSYGSEDYSSDEGESFRKASSMHNLHEAELLQYKDTAANFDIDYLKFDRHVSQKPHPNQVQPHRHVSSKPLRTKSKNTPTVAPKKNKPKTSHLLNDNEKAGLEMSRLKIMELQNENADLKRQIKEALQELRTLKRQNKIQDKEITKIQNQEADMPNVVQRLMEDIHVLQTQLKRMRERCDTVTRQNKQLETELTKNKNKLGHLLSLAEDMELEERDTLAKEVGVLQAKLEFEERRNRELEYNLELVQKNHRHEMSLENSKQKTLRKEYLELRHTLVNVETQLKEKVKLLEMNHIHSAPRRGNSKPPLGGRPSQAPLHLPSFNNSSSVAKVNANNSSLSAGTSKGASSSLPQKNNKNLSSSRRHSLQLPPTELAEQPPATEAPINDKYILSQQVLHLKCDAVANTNPVESQSSPTVTQTSVQTSIENMINIKLEEEKRLLQQEMEEDERRLKSRLLEKLGSLDSRADKMTYGKRQSSENTPIVLEQPNPLHDDNLFLTQSPYFDEEMESLHQLSSTKINGANLADDDDHDHRTGSGQTKSVIYQGAPGLMANHRRRKSPKHYTGDSLDLEEMQL